MTTQQLHLFNALYLVVLIVVALLTRATAQRIAGALAGGAAVGVGGWGSSPSVSGSGGGTCRSGARRTRSDEVGRRTGPRGPAGASLVGGRLTSALQRPAITS